MIGFAAMYENENKTVSPFTVDTTLLQRILTALNVEVGAPSLATLDALVDAYVRSVPWESASRIARRTQTPRLSDCPRWPVTFGDSALASGTGGGGTTSSNPSTGVTTTVNQDTGAFESKAGAGLSANVGVTLSPGQAVNYHVIDLEQENAFGERVNRPFMALPARKAASPGVTRPSASPAAPVTPRPAAT